MIIATSIIMASWLLFHIPVRGNVLTLFVLTFLFLSVCLGFGLFASTIAENQQQAAQIVMFVVPPSILLSGYIFPREGMPLPIYAISFAIPLTYFVKIIRGIILKGLGFADLWEQILPLAAMALVIMFVSIRKFHKRLA
jgi:ABC-2 type transport system permease protein